MITKEDVIHSLKSYVEINYGGDYKKVFDLYAGTVGKINQKQVETLLYNAGVGFAFTRSMIAERIIEELDKDGDKLISWEEFNNVLQIK